MKVFNNKFNLKLTNNCTLVIGNFDGLHKGHFSILNEAIKFAKQKKLKTGLLTFDPNPKEFFLKAKNFKIISLIEKQKILSKMKLDFLIIIKFNKNLRNLSAKDFIIKILKKKLIHQKLLSAKNLNLEKIEWVVQVY